MLFKYNKFTYLYMQLFLFSLAALCKVWVCSRLFAEIVGSNPAGGMDVCLSWVLCVRGLHNESITHTVESYFL